MSAVRYTLLRAPRASAAETTGALPVVDPAAVPDLPALQVPVEQLVAEHELAVAAAAAGPVAFTEQLRAEVRHVALAHGTDPSDPLVHDLVATVARLTLRESARRTLLWAADEVAGGVGVAYPATLAALAERAHREIR